MNQVSEDIQTEATVNPEGDMSMEEMPPEGIDMEQQMM
jgi:hypothetical protein